MLLKKIGGWRMQAQRQNVARVATKTWSGKKSSSQ